jgi:hypothetical protein
MVKHLPGMDGALNSIHSTEKRKKKKKEEKKNMVNIGA